MLLYYITDSGGRADRASWIEARVLAAARAGVDWIQLREKDLGGRALYELAAALRHRLDERCARSRPRLLINDRLDIALAAGLDGVHVPAAGLFPAAIRGAGKLPAGFLVIISCHARAEVVAAAAAGASACVLGPIFATPGKAGQGAPLGPEALAIGREAPIPVLALGGVTVANTPACLAAGAAGVAAIRLFQDSADLAATCATLRQRRAISGPEE